MAGVMILSLLQIAVTCGGLGPAGEGVVGCLILAQSRRGHPSSDTARDSAKVPLRMTCRDRTDRFRNRIRDGPGGSAEGEGLSHHRHGDCPQCPAQPGATAVWSAGAEHVRE